MRRDITLTQLDQLICVLLEQLRIVVSITISTSVSLVKPVIKNSVLLPEEMLPRFMTLVCQLELTRVVATIPIQL